MQTQNNLERNFSTELFLAIKVEARKYFFNERLNFGITPTVMEIKEYLSYYHNDNELPSINTITRWHTSWKRSN